MTLPWPSRPSACAAASSSGSGARSYWASRRSASASNVIAKSAAGRGPSCAFMERVQSFERSQLPHQRGAVIEHRQDLLAPLGREHPNGPRDACVTIALERVGIARRREHVIRQRGGIAPFVFRHLAELAQLIDRIDAAPADWDPAVPVG